MKTAVATPETSAAAHNAPSQSMTWLHNVRVPLSDQVDVAGFHTEATRLLAQQVPPETVQWSAAPAQSVGEEDLDAGRAAIHNRAARAIIPQSFIRMSELVVLHRDPQRFDLLYRSLWRLVYEPDLKKDYGDADLARLRQMAQAVRRDIQKMKAKLVFRPLTLNGESVPVARYEPSHYVCEIVGAWLAKREPARRWLLLTPDRSLLWNGERLLSAPAVAPMQDMQASRSEEEWSGVLEKLPWA
jgi:probable DNA metabolism protein